MCDPVMTQSTGSGHGSQHRRCDPVTRCSVYPVRAPSLREADKRNPNTSHRSGPQSARFVGWTDITRTERELSEVDWAGLSVSVDRPAPRLRYPHTWRLPSRRGPMLRYSQ